MTIILENSQFPGSFGFSYRCVVEYKNQVSVYFTSDEPIGWIVS